MLRFPARIGLDSALVAAGALLFAVIANGVSPRGISLTAPMQPASTEAVKSAADLIRLKSLYPPGSFVLVDAQSPADYRAGHIPDAVSLDLAHPESSLGPVLQACARAEAIVVYCKSAECGSAEAAASLLREAHVPPNGRLYLYRGGLRDWTAGLHPIAEGDAP